MDYNYSEKIITNSYSIFSEKKELKIDLDLYRLNAFKNLIIHFSNSNKNWNYYISEKKGRYSRVIIENIGRIRWYKCPELTENNVSDFCTHICFDCKKFDKLSVQTFFRKQ